MKILIVDPWVHLPLTNGGYTLVSVSDLPYIIGRRWYRTGNRVRDTKTKEELSRFIMWPEAGLVVDHINRNSLDNRRTNLRICSVGENARNKRGKLSDTGFIGVNRDKRSKIPRYHAAVKVGKKKHYLGSFLDPVEAAKERDRVAKKLHGKYAVLNFPEEK